MKKFLKTLYITLVLALCLWVFASICEVAVNNGDLQPTENPYNAFVILSEWSGDIE